MFFLIPALLFSQTKDKKIEEQDVKELEELIEGKKKESVKVEEIKIEPKKEEMVKVEEIKPVSSVFHKTLGNNISISGTDQLVTIKTGTSTIVIDAQGKVQIHAAQSVTLQPETQILAKEEIKELQIKGPEPASEKVIEDFSEEDEKEEAISVPIETVE